MTLSPLNLALSLGMLPRTSSTPSTANLGSYIAAGAIVALASNLTK